jgi:hypothetical protein
MVSLSAQNVKGSAAAVGHVAPGTRIFLHDGVGIERDLSGPVASMHSERVSASGEAGRAPFLYEREMVQSGS